MNRKELISPERRRRVPEGFGWVDHRLVRDGHFMNCDNGALALYLFLITVGNNDGVSWYSDKSLCSQLCCGEETIRHYRRHLVDSGLIAWRRPVYQVLDLSPASYDTTTFSQLLRESVHRNSKSDEGADRRQGECRMISPHYRVPDNQGVTRRLGDVIGNMIKGEGQ